MHGREAEEKRKRKWHMWRVPVFGKTVAAVHSTTTTVVTNFFYKDGRKISVGDCALFKPPQDTSPPFIGIIRWLTSSKEDCLKLGVNWLYRPADVKLGKGILLEAAPNEVFYSFHKDEILAASILHPCKVAFLRKGFELPSGISSFVCRRVYDTTNKCLWRLTDQDYINERQEEVDQLLDKTRQEMHAAVQSGGRSPKSLNGPTSTQQLKPGTDSAHSSPTSFSSQVKGKKRERVDQASEPIKRERLLKTDEGDLGNCNLESMIKSEIAKIKRERSLKTDEGDLGNCKLESMIKSEIAKIKDYRGGLANFKGVEKLVQLMQPDRTEKKVDLASRIMLLDVIAVTDQFECLGQFMQLRGIAILDEWLQEVHKGKVGDCSSPKESDKSVEDFLFALLRALNKLPVNLHALQTCNVGKSVNNLRTHKNLEIQKKARSLVDTWKKRVEAEMRSNEAKSRSNQAMSWPTKPGPPEVSPGGNKRIGVSSEAPTKSSVTQPSAYKTTPVKLGHGDGTPKPTTSSPGSVKPSASSPASVAMTSKESHCKTAVSPGASDIPPTTMKEEKSSSSGQSQNNSQSCSSDQAKNVGFAWKEDARSSTAGSMNVNMTSSGASRHRKPNNGILGSPVSGVQKETPFSKSGSLNRSGTSEKVLQSGLTCERTHDVPVVEHGNSHRFIVRLPNPGRSPAQSASGGLFDDASITTSRASSPSISEKHDQYDRKLKGRSDSSCRRNSTDINPESWQSNDVRNGFSGSDEGVGSPAPVLDEELCRTPATGKSMETTKATCSSSINDKGVISSESKPGKAHNASVSSINVLIESCVKYSETNASMPVGDDIGMNLLASVAAGEMTKLDQASPLSSPGRNSALQEDSSTGNETKSRFSREDVPARYEDKSENDAGGDFEKQGNVDGPSPVNNGLLHTSNISDSKNNSSFTREKATGGCSEKFKATSYNLQQNAGSNIKLDGKPDKTVSTVSMVVSSAKMGEEDAMGDIVDELHKKQKTSVSDLKNDGGEDLKPKAEYPFPDENKVDPGDEVSASNKTVASDPVHGSVGGRCETDILSSSIKVEKEAVKESKLLEMNDEKTLPSDPDAMDATRAIKDCADNVMHQSGLANVLKKKGFVVSKCEKVDSVEVSLKFKRRMNKITRNFSMELIDVIPDGQVGTSAVAGHIDVCTKDESDNKEVLKQQSCESALNAESPIIPAEDAEDAEHRTKSVGSKTSGVEGDGSDECASTAEATTLSVAEGCDKGGRLDFDLNEGFSLDEGNQTLPVTLAGPGCLPAVHLPSTLQFPLSSITNGLPASITVAAAAKGPFVPPENPLKGTGELGWKGSAATSAFRPAEPRKVLEMPLSTSDFPPDVNAGRQGRPALDIDLNVADEINLEDMIPQTSVREISSESGIINYRALGRNAMLCSAPASVCSTGGLDLDLNRVDEDNDVVQFSANAIRRVEVPLMPAGPSASGGYPIVEMNALRDFDLNNGPGLDDMGTEPVLRGQHAKSSVPFLSSVNGPRMSSTELGSLSSWLPHGNSYPAVAFPSILSDRGEQPYPGAGSASMQRMLGPPFGGLTFSPDVFRGPVLSSSPAVAFSPAAPFSYPGFSFGASYPFTSTSFTGGSASYMESSSGGGLCFPAVPSQLVGPAGSVSSQYPRPSVMSLPDGSNGGAESSRNWRRQGLDLNAGPGATDLEGRDERLPSTSRQLSMASSHALAEEHARMYQVAGGLLKRKEPEGGWDAERFSYKQPSWQ